MRGPRAAVYWPAGSESSHGTKLGMPMPMPLQAAILSGPAQPAPALLIPDAPSPSEPIAIVAREGFVTPSMQHLGQHTRVDPALQGICMARARTYTHTHAHMHARMRVRCCPSLPSAAPNPQTPACAAPCTTPRCPKPPNLQTPKPCAAPWTIPRCARRAWWSRASATSCWRRPGRGGE